MIAYGLYFQKKGDDATRIRLPVNPEELAVEGSAETGDYNVLGIGQVLQPRTPNLRKFTVESFFPAKPYAGWGNRDIQKPQVYISYFRAAMDTGTVLTFVPMRYTEQGAQYAEILYGFDVVVTSFSYKEQGGETGDFRYSLSCTEYKDFSPRVYVPVNTLAAGGVTEVAPEPTRETPPPEIVVGSVCTANGRYYASSYGQEPHGTANGRRVKVSRIVSASRAYPYHITTENGGWLGWIKREALTAVQNP